MVLADGAHCTPLEEFRRTVRENRNDYAEHLQREMREFIANEISRIRADLVRNLPEMIRRECKRVLSRALAPVKKKPAKKCKP